MKSILNDPPMSFSEHGRTPWPEVENLLTKAMAKNPEDRFASVEEFLKTLKEVRLSI